MNHRPNAVFRRMRSRKFLSRFVSGASGPHASDAQKHHGFARLVLTSDSEQTASRKNLSCSARPRSMASCWHWDSRFPYVASNSTSRSQAPIFESSEALTIVFFSSFFADAARPRRPGPHRDKGFCRCIERNSCVDRRPEQLVRRGNENLVCLSTLPFANRLFMLRLSSTGRCAPGTLRMQSFMCERPKPVQALRALRKLHQFIEEGRVIVTFKFEAHSHYVLVAVGGAHDQGPAPPVPTFSPASLAISVFAYSRPASWNPFTFAYSASLSW